MKSTIRIVFAATLVASALLAGCSHGGSGGGGSFGYQTNTPMGNVKCTAVDTAGGGRTFKGWSTIQSRARDNAMDKCRAHSKQSGACKITHCVSDT